MESLNVVDAAGGRIGEVAVSKKLRELSADAQLIHDVIVGYMRNQRRGTASTLTRGEVRGSGIKPWRQKGTGRARAGMRRSPLWRGGGATFGPKPRSFYRVIPKGLRNKALGALFADKVRNGKVIIVESIEAPGGKSKALAGLFRKIGAGRKPLIVSGQRNKETGRAVRNIAGADLVEGNALNPWLIISHDTVVMTRADFENLQEKLG